VLNGKGDDWEWRWKWAGIRGWTVFLPNSHTELLIPVPYLETEHLKKYLKRNEGVRW
jgi:hypothetical protein